ncbi:MAG TPA: hypothetical protein PKW21_01645 [Rhabdaerophilum sp.]|nr:hypothetical protein [Rhabdaerophilum sp.]
MRHFEGRGAGSGKSGRDMSGPIEQNNKSGHPERKNSDEGRNHERMQEIGDARGFPGKHRDCISGNAGEMKLSMRIALRMERQEVNRQPFEALSQLREIHDRDRQRGLSTLGSSNRRDQGQLLAPLGAKQHKIDAGLAGIAARIPLAQAIEVLPRRPDPDELRDAPLPVSRGDAWRIENLALPVEFGPSQRIGGCLGKPVSELGDLGFEHLPNDLGFAGTSIPVELVRRPDEQTQEAGCRQNSADQSQFDSPDQRSSLHAELLARQGFD